MALPEQQPYQDRIITDPEILVGKPVIRGTRIAVEHVLEALADNPDLTELFAAYPRLTRADVQACLAYAQALVAGEDVTPRPKPRPGKQRAAPQAL